MFYIEHGFSHRLIANGKMQNNFFQRKHEWVVYVKLLNPSAQCIDIQNRLKVPQAIAQDIIKDVRFLFPRGYSNRHRKVSVLDDEANRNPCRWFECL